MTTNHKTALAVTAFAGVVLVLVLPYLVARYRPVEPLSPTGQIDSQPEIATPEMGQPNTLQISSLGIQAPVMYIDEKTESAYQTALRHGVVHFPDTALAGEPGNVYIFGHSSDYVWSAGDYKNIFAKLPQIEIGSDIELSNAAGEIFHYTVIETKVVSPRDLSVLDQYNYERSMLTLQTSYPLGTALQRYIVIAELAM